MDSTKELKKASVQENCDAEKPEENGPGTFEETQAENQSRNRGRCFYPNRVYENYWLVEETIDYELLTKAYR